MNPNKINIRFLLAKNRMNKMGKCSIRCRVIYQKNRYEYATGLFIKPEFWNSKEQEAQPPDEENNFINSELSLIKSKINKAFLFLQVQEIEFNVRDIYNQYAGVKLDKDRSILEVFEFHIQKQKKLIGIETTETSIAKFHQTQKHLKTFLWFTYKRKDMSLKELKYAFIEEFEFYLKTEKKFSPHTVYKTIQRFKQMVRVGISLGYLDKNPFMMHVNHKPKKEVVFLTVEELEKLENHNFKIKRIEQIRDLFVFCCYTGLAFTEMKNLEKKHIVQGFDSNQWIKMVRQKTKRTVSVPLLPKAMSIIEKYEVSDEVYVFPRISNQKFNAYLKEVADIVGIEKNLTHHLGRKTFATTVLLYNDVPMEIVSELLGHSKLSITQESYAKVVQKKVSEHISKLSEKLAKK